MRVLLAFLLSMPCYSNTFEIYGGSITHHWYVKDKNINKRLSNKLNDKGTIANPLAGAGYYFRKDKYYSKARLFVGENSAGGWMAGGAYSTGFNWKYLELGPILGLYVQDNKAFHERNIIPFAFNPRSKVGYVPVLGLELNISIPITKHIKFKIINIYSAIISNHSVGLEFNF